MLAKMYDVDVRTINYHIKKVFADSELEPEATIRKFRIVQNEGSRQITRDIDHYNLQMIIAVTMRLLRYCPAVYRNRSRPSPSRP